MVKEKMNKGFLILLSMAIYFCLSVFTKPVLAIAPLTPIPIFEIAIALTVIFSLIIILYAYFKKKDLKNFVSKSALYLSFIDSILFFILILYAKMLPSNITTIMMFLAALFFALIPINLVLNGISSYYFRQKEFYLLTTIFTLWIILGITLLEAITTTEWFFWAALMSVITNVLLSYFGISNFGRLKR